MIISVVIIIYSTIIYQCQTKRARVGCERTRTVSHCFILSPPSHSDVGFPIGRHRNRRKNTLTIITVADGAVTVVECREITVPKQTQKIILKKLYTPYIVSVGRKSRYSKSTARTVGIVGWIWCLVEFSTKVLGPNDGSESTSVGSTSFSEPCVIKVRNFG